MKTLPFAARFVGTVTLIMTLAIPAWAYEIERFHEPGPGSVNTWILEGEDGVVLIDGQRTIQAGQDLAERIEATGKPLLAILITHPHPDHVGGIPSILQAFPDTPVVALQATADEMQSDSLGMFAFARRVNGDAYPTQLAAVTRVVVDGEVLRFGDIALTVDDIGAGESIAMTIFYDQQNGAVFVGDLTDNDKKGFLLEQRTTQWLRQLDYVTQKYGRDQTIAYPGHGAQAPLSKLAEEQAVWITDMHGLVRVRIEDGVFTDEEATEVAEEFELLHPGQEPVAPIPDFMRLNAQAIAEELLRER